ncbi:MAG TPA: protein kinase [Steroidobacteraceae bacterium]|nr:protein kinase [Steroidobacteraceae bacterium]
MLDLTPGLEIGARFALIRRLGRGGAAEVWLADDRERGETVALKVLDPADPPDPGLARRLADEIARARRLPRGHAVTMHDLAEAEGLLLVPMEYLPGGDLGQFRGRSFESWAAAAGDVAAALAACHAAGLVHRDLKCGNVLLDAEGRAKLADFGIAAAAGSRVPAGGSPYNASPQQLRGEPAQPADDLYALGALLYELIAGHPPFYPEVTRDRVLHEPVPPLVPRGEVPVGVRELALRLLAKSPGERPASAEEVRARLAAADTGDAGLVEPLAHALPSQSRPARRGMGWMPAAVAAIVVAIAAVFIWLPERFTGGGGFEQEARSEAQRLAQEQQAREQALADAATARAAAEQARGKFEASFAALDARAAARWATADFAAARDAGAAAAQRFSVEDFKAAAAGWEEAAKLLDALEARKPQALADALARGGAALKDGQVAAARDAFGLALGIEPEHAGAKAGMARADRIEQTFAVVDAAAADERAGRLSAAEQGFRRALSIDPAAPGAAEGLARIAGRRTAEAYAAAMSRGLADMTAGRADSARSAFREALALRPGSQEAADALVALDQGQRAGALKTLESRARAAEADERWSEALAAWREAAALEPSLQSAREGVARAGPRAELQGRIEALNREPQRLWDAAGRAEARQLIAAANATGNPRQRLAAAAAELGRLAAAAQTPVRLRLQSDGVTSVTIYRVGQYGSFSVRDVELLPGRYTVVGTRNGYRDVRQEVVLPPGTPEAAVVVKCEEPI